MERIRHAGAMLREWRGIRRLSQMELALRSGISSRHLSYVETGKSTPGRAVVLELAEQLDMPLRVRNQTLLMAGHAPCFPDQTLDDPSRKPFREMIERVLKGHEPYPALAVDRHWNLVAANAALRPLLELCAPFLLQPPVNVLRLALHPEGLARAIVNLGEWHALITTRLRHQLRQAPDPTLMALLRELSAFPAPPAPTPPQTDTVDLAVPITLRTPEGLLNLIGISMVFGSPWDVTVSEIAIEAFLPADESTAQLLVRS
ncbi:MAG TPA: helix-turn-helix transcriptional regulator [Beijerinckiaceae bacterium]|nr:helix-turn-helix transcriptional regulator [Beijerinckiaceae bacterium]